MTSKKPTIKPHFSKLVDGTHPPATAPSGIDKTLVNQIVAVLTVVIPVLLTYMASRGWVSVDVVGSMTDEIIQIVVAGIALIAAVWAFVTNRKAAQISRVANMPDVQAVVTTSAIAHGPLAANPKVIAQQPTS